MRESKLEILFVSGVYFTNLPKLTIVLYTDKDYAGLKMRLLMKRL